MRSFASPDFTPLERGLETAYTAGQLDRLAEERQDDCLEQAAAHPGARYWGVVPGRVLLNMENSPHGLFRLDELEQFSPRKERLCLLGYDNGDPRLVLPLGIKPDEEGNIDLPEPFKAIDLRSLAAQALLPPGELAQVAYGSSLAAWHGTHRFCARCGNSTDLKLGGAKRICSTCQTEHFPRTDPVVIMVAVKGDQCLLGRSHNFPPGMYSALAGFVEPGESLENAVRRETFEEAGIRIGAVHYHASQPWPFPHTLMIGCYAEALEEDIDHDAVELDDCRWFSRTELADILAGTGRTNEEGEPLFVTPPKFAIANLLVRDWVSGNAPL